MTSNRVPLFAMDALRNDPLFSELLELYRVEFFTATKFFQDHGLLTEHLVDCIDDVDDHFAVWMDQLTPRGLEFARFGWVPWTRSLDRGARRKGKGADSRFMERKWREFEARESRQ